MSPELRGLLTGVYRHYKGHHYLVLSYAQDANNDDRIVVVYVGLEPQGAKSGVRMFVRALEDFVAVVDPTTGDERDVWDGTEPAPVRRFTYVGPMMPLSADEPGT